MEVSYLAGQLFILQGDMGDTGSRQEDYWTVVEGGGEGLGRATSDEYSVVGVT